jgi:small subunit ribosomal protein S20
LVNAKKELENKILISKLKTMLKKYNAAVNAGNIELSEKLLPETLGYIDNLKHKGVIHKNNADRKKSAVSRKIFLLKNKLNQKPAAEVTQAAK